jgi:hypothetical protein
VTGDVDTFTNPKTTSTLTINPTKAENAGDYKCAADFGGTKVESNSATVNIFGKGQHILLLTMRLHMYIIHVYLTKLI